MLTTGSQGPAGARVQSNAAYLLPAAGPSEMTQFNTRGCCVIMATLLSRWKTSHLLYPGSLPPHLPAAGHLADGGKKKCSRILHPSTNQLEGRERRHSLDSPQVPAQLHIQPDIINLDSTLPPRGLNHWTPVQVWTTQ